MSYDIKMSQLPKVEHSPQQKKLNRLIERIEQQKQELAAWQNAQADIQNYTRSKLLPVYSELHTVLFVQLDTLWSHLASDGFSKVDLAQIDTKIAALAKMLRKSQMLTSAQKEQVEKIDTFYMQHAEHIRAKKAKANSIQSHELVETVEQNVDVDWENYEYDSAQYEAERERAKQLKQQEKREQAAKMAAQSLKTVYLKITAMIHPDREPDEEKKLEKPFTPDVKKESAPKAAPAEEKKPVKKEAVQVEKASEEAPAKAAAPKERPARDFQGKAKPAREKQPRAPKERQPKETRERAPKQGRPIEILSDPEKIREVEERAVVFLRDVFGSMDLGEVEITSKYNTADGSLDVDFEGEDMGILIGKRGQTLDSLQYLTSLVVNKGESTYIRVKLDTEDYRRRRKETLENLARGIAFKVKKTRKPVVLEPMNPYERRIIHASLQGNRYVETVSEGEEPYRHVVVKLKRNN